MSISLLVYTTDWINGRTACVSGTSGLFGFRLEVPPFGRQIGGGGDWKSEGRSHSSDHNLAIAMRLNLKGKNRRRNSSTRAVYLFFAYMSVAIIAGTWFLVLHHQLLKNSATTTATILRSGRNWVEYGFLVDGTEFRDSESGNHYKGPNVAASPVKVTYSKPDPTFNTLTPDENFNNGRLGLGIGFGGIIVVGGLITLAKFNLLPKSFVTTRPNSAVALKDGTARYRKVRDRRIVGFVGTMMIAMCAFFVIRAWIPIHRIGSHPASTIAEMTRLDPDSGEITYRFSTPRGFVSGTTNTKSYWGPRAVGLGVLLDYATDDPKTSMLNLEMSKRNVGMSMFFWITLACLGLLLWWLLARASNFGRSAIRPPVGD